MPHMDGLTATRAIRALEAESGAARTSIIMLSANAMAEHQNEALAAGADLHVAKPITAANLLAGIQAAVASL
jgi:CheY-like chemotaxis protein